MMPFKKVVEKKVMPPEPAYEVEETTLLCSLCDYKEGPEFGSRSSPEEKMQHHYGKEHAAKEEKTVGEHTFYRFESEEDAKAFLFGLDDPEYSGLEEPRSIVWVGAGWYASRTYQDLGNCRCGKCLTYYYELRSNEWFTYHYADQAKALDKQAADLREKAVAIEKSFNPSASEEAEGASHVG